MTHFFSIRRMSRCLSGVLSGRSLRGEGGQLQYTGAFTLLPTILNVITVLRVYALVLKGPRGDLRARLL